MIKAIETIYDNYRFRSRIEARWAVFFNTVGVEYQYEPERFDLGNGVWYLPDFWLPQLLIWLEIKSAFPIAEEMQKIALLARPEWLTVITWGNLDGKDKSDAMAFCRGYDDLFECWSESITEILFASYCDWTDSEIAAGYAAARQARFEKGAR